MLISKLRCHYSGVAVRNPLCFGILRQLHRRALGSFCTHQHSQIHQHFTCRNLPCRHNGCGLKEQSSTKITCQISPPKFTGKVGRVLYSFVQLEFLNLAFKIAWSDEVTQVHQDHCPKLFHYPPVHDISISTDRFISLAKPSRVGTSLCPRGRHQSAPHFPSHQPSHAHIPHHAHSGEMSNEPNPSLVVHARV